MEQLKSLIESSVGLDSFDKLLKTIADTLNISVQQLTQNLPMYIEQGASYAFWSNVAGFIFLWIVLAIAIGALVGLMVGALFSLIYDDEELSIKAGLITMLGVSVFATVFTIIVEFCKYKSSPALYLLKYLGFF